MEAHVHILLVDDEPLSSKVYTYMIHEAELGRTRECTDSRQALPILRSDTFDLVVLDLNMPYISGQDLLEQIALEFPDIPVLILTNEDRVETAVECMKRGAFDFMSKPIDRNRFLSALRHALTIRELKKEVNILSARKDELDLNFPEAFSKIVTVSSEMKALFAYIEAIAPSSRAVLITGESGTGKELIARVIHTVSGRTGAFIPINVSGLDDAVFSDSLFGHIKGSYTGAEGMRKGFIEQARKGTLFLDEIGDLEMGAQIKLLRLLQEGEYYPLGSDKPMKSEARIIAATNADLLERQGQGLFRRDLYYRLISHQIHLPPLRERKEDISFLLEHFLKEASNNLGKEKPPVSQELIKLLEAYDFPGNVRQLQAMCYDAMSRLGAKGLELTFFSKHMEEKAGTLKESAGASSLENSSGPLFFEENKNQVSREEIKVKDPSVPEILDEEPKISQQDRYFEQLRVFFKQQGLLSLEDLENLIFDIALEMCHGSQTQAAKILGISQSTLSRWQKKNLSIGPEYLKIK